MDNRELEQRIATLEQQLNPLKADTLPTSVPTARASASSKSKCKA